MMDGPVRSAHPTRLTVFSGMGGAPGACPAPPGGQNLHCIPHPGAKQASPTTTLTHSPPLLGERPRRPQPRSGSLEGIQAPPPGCQAVGRGVSEHSVTGWRGKAGRRTSPSCPPQEFLCVNQQGLQFTREVVSCIL